MKQFKELLKYSVTKVLANICKLCVSQIPMKVTNADDATYNFIESKYN